MVRNFLFFSLIGLVSISMKKAGGERQSSSSQIIYYMDIEGNKDSVLPGESNQLDLKYGFKDLFVHSSMNGITVDHLNPRAINFVQDYIIKHGKKLESMKDWGKPYFDMMDAVMIQHGLPRELKYLAVIESHLKSNAVSWAGAVGPWQFMPSTARRFGLNVNARIDERTDYHKSTHAAAGYLNELFYIYGDWLLVIAAYNGGPGIVNSAIKRSKSKDFWSLQNYLPAESRNHVKKFIATHFIMEGQGGITTLTRSEANNILITQNDNSMLGKEELANTRTQPISGRYNSMVITKYILMDVATFNRMNPDFDKLIANNGKYELRLPSEKMEIFLAKKSEILSESMQILLNSVSDNKNMPGKGNR